MSNSCDRKHPGPSHRRTSTESLKQGSGSRRRLSSKLDARARIPCKASATIASLSTAHQRCFSGSAQRIFAWRIHIKSWE